MDKIGYSHNKLIIFDTNVTNMTKYVFSKWLKWLKLLVDMALLIWFKIKSYIIYMNI
jgi:hypothetical protein